MNRNRPVSLSLPSITLALALLFNKKATTVEAAAFFDPVVRCLPEYPAICAGNTQGTSPSPAQTCNYDDDLQLQICTTMYIGGYSWTFDFVEGVEEGTVTSLLNKTELDKISTGLQVVVRMEDDLTTCSVTVGEDTCSSCSVCKSTFYIFSASCTNIAMGRDVDCEPVEPLFYPLVLESDDSEIITDSADATNDSGGNVLSFNFGYFNVVAVLMALSTSRYFLLF